MAQKERKEEAARRVRREFDTYAGSVLLSEPEGAAVSGDSSYTWKSWRLSRSGKGPEWTYLNGQVRYSVAAIRSWLARSACPANQTHHAPKPPAVASSVPPTAKKPDLVVEREAPKRTPIPGPNPKRRTRNREIA
jgi:hypothetical protein